MSNSNVLTLIGNINDDLNILKDARLNFNDFSYDISCAKRKLVNSYYKLKNVEKNNTDVFNLSVAGKEGLFLLCNKIIIGLIDLSNGDIYNIDSNNCRIVFTDENLHIDEVLFICNYSSNCCDCYE